MAGHVAFPGDALADGKRVDAFADLGNIAGIFVADDHRHRDGVPGPRVPVVDMHVGAANAGLVDADKHVARSDCRNGHVAEPKSGFRFIFDQGSQWCSLIGSDDAECLAGVAEGVDGEADVRRR